MDEPPSASSQKLPPSSHRLPTVSASQALKSLQAQGPRAIPTGLGQLDKLLVNTRKLNGISGATSLGGYERGKVTEAWGPPGSGKTSLAMQAAAGALRAGNSVVWVDAGSQRVKPRFDRVFPNAENDTVNEFKHYCAPTVAHILALLMHTPRSFPPHNTALMVIDDLHAVFDVAYPRYRSNGFSSKNDSAKWAAGRRYSVLGSTIAALKKLAALNDMAILITTGCATRVRFGTGLGAMLVPGIGGVEWESGIANRLVIFRDFAPMKDRVSKKQIGESAASSRFIGLQKVNGSVFGDDGHIGQLVAFGIAEAGLMEIEHTPAMMDTTSFARSPSPVKGRKRNHNEIADSDEEDAGSEYGWLDEDAEGLIDAAALNEDDPNRVEILSVDD